MIVIGVDPHKSTHTPTALGRTAFITRGAIGFGGA